jgi:hypothetical protein
VERLITEMESDFDEEIDSSKEAAADIAKFVRHRLVPRKMGLLQRWLHPANKIVVDALVVPTLSDSSIPPV